MQNKGLINLSLPPVLWSQPEKFSVAIYFCRMPEGTEKQYKLTAESTFSELKQKRKQPEGKRPATVDTDNKMLRNPAFKILNFIFP